MSGRRLVERLPPWMGSIRVRLTVLYSVVLVGVTVVPFFYGALGLFYLVAAVALGAWFIWLAIALARRITPRRASLLFHCSLLYLALLFVAAATDVVI